MEPIVLLSATDRL